jgi:general secretion pathway protein F
MRQLTPLRVVATRGEEKSGFRLSGGLSAKERSLLTRQLAVLLQSEMPVEMALAAAAGDETNPGVRKLLLGIRSQVLEGTRLADAMKGAPKAFPQLYRSVVAAGEAAGRLGEVMEQLAEYLETSLRVRNQIQAALIYPAVLGIMAILMVSALMIWVVPRLIEQFDILGADQLPPLTQFVIGLSGFMRDWGPALVMVVAALVIFSKRALDVPAFKRKADQMSLRLPYFGTLQRTVAAARFARIYATLSVSGATVLESLSAARGAMTNLVFVDAATRISEAVREGGTVSGAMKATGIFPSIMTHMVASGEVARNVPAMMNRAADFLEAEFETSTNVALGLLEPFIIVVLGGVVGTIVLSIMLPIMQLNTLALD